ncbi:hypothetical protein EC973_009567 [Apophysomyces ossiformis]|uniref:Zn(2)-C6 fungal-type domain-containing protein n=1 Tax=Apophysomyces ossiformis TaxID=679940 RepID=A0A8H7EP28_9FUNG|nr:hypothetical protein EC973_009567 [Apophysomyces ossiformis]
MSSAKKLRILCLHGYVQNGPVFRKKTAVVRKKLDKIADLVYVTAPHVVVNPKYTSEAHREAAADPNAPEEAKAFGWWHADQVTPEGYYPGFKESVSYLKDILLKEGPFDGVFGFSQGACLAAILTELLENRTLVPELLSSEFDHPAFKFAIVVAGFIPTSQTATKAVFQDKIQTPSMHMFGEKDTLVLPERMEALTTVFKDPLILVHPGGTLGSQRTVIRSCITAPRDFARTGQKLYPSSSKSEPYYTMQFVQTPYYGYAQQSANQSTLQNPHDQHHQQQQHINIPSAGLPFVPPAQQAPTAAQQPNQAYAALTKPKRKQVKNACVNCQKACKKCDDGRPCQRCIKYGLTDTCVNSVRKERKKGIKRGPYKRRNQGDGNQSETSSTPTTPVPSMPSNALYATGVVRTNTVPMSYAGFNPAHYETFHDYQQMLPPYNMMPSSLQQQVYPPTMPYQQAMNPVSQTQSPVMHGNFKQELQQPQVAQAPSVAEKSTKGSDSDEEGSKLNILSQLCSAVLDHNSDGPKQEQASASESTTYSASSPNRHMPAVAHNANVVTAGANYRNVPPYSATYVNGPAMQNRGGMYISPSSSASTPLAFSPSAGTEKNLPLQHAQQHSYNYQQQQQQQHHHHSQQQQHQHHHHSQQQQQVQSSTPNNNNNNSNNNNNNWNGNPMPQW